ncbi:MAG: tripartite tricarboxylate transporter substrate binding protein [Shinella sp.]|uniref:tripartite tricarboxylate transporter substrate binding protein n=1 Tax=Shinella sp. TaxID=1870904 RepID=UPI003C78CD3D
MNIKLLFATALAGTLLGITGAHAEYPERPIQMVVPWGAGGGSDAVARMIANLMEKELGKPIAVINKTGGSGAVGHQAIASAKPDGYTIGMVTLEITTMHWVGFSQLTSADFTAFGQVNFDPAAVTVAADSPFNSLKDFLEAAKAEPGKMKSSGGGAGSFGHIALAGLLKTYGAAPDATPWVTMDSAAAAQQELMASGIAVVGSSLGETRALAEAGKVKSLAVMADERLYGFDNVPTVKEEGVDWSYGTWRGFAGPKDMPQEAVDKLGAALEKAYHSEEFQEFMKNRGFGLQWRNGADFAAFMSQADSVNGQLLKEIGLAQ